MFCTSCEGKHASHATGTCASCGNGTSSISYILCDFCAEESDCCMMCGRNLFGGSQPSQPKKGVFFVKKNEKDNGGKCFLKIGEEVHITLPEDQSLYREWEVDDFSRNILDLEEVGDFEPTPGDYQHGTRTIRFTGTTRGQGDIELECGSQTWQITVTVK